MIHGDCSSRGCYAMTDEQIGEIYSLAREAFLGGQKAFQVQAYPFRMTPANMARHRDNPNMAFWKMIKVGNDHFEVSHQEPKVDVCEKHYVFDAVSPAGSTKPLAFSPSGRCPAYEIDPNVEEQAMAKRKKNDDYQFAQLQNVATVPLIRHRQQHEPRVHEQAGKSDLHVRQRRPPARAAGAGRPAAAADFDQKIIVRGRQSIEHGGGTVSSFFGGLFNKNSDTRRLDRHQLHRVYERRFSEPRQLADAYRLLLLACSRRATRSRRMRRPIPSRRQRLRRRRQNPTNPPRGRGITPTCKKATPHVADTTKPKNAADDPRRHPHLRRRPTAPRRRQATMACSTARNPWCRPARSITAGADSSNQASVISRLLRSPFDCRRGSEWLP